MSTKKPCLEVENECLVTRSCKTASIKKIDYPALLVKARIKIKELESDLSKKENSEVLRRIAASVAHDINNYFMIIVSELSTLTNHNNSINLQQNINFCMEIINKCLALNRSLLSLDEFSKNEFRTFELSELLSSSAIVIGKVFPKNIAIKLTILPTPIEIYGNSWELEQALLNLALNAKDAMPNGGLLSITAEEQSEAVKIKITDTGTGIELQNQSKIFEPFFTTKNKIKNKGLGLSSVKTIIKKHSGNIKVYSTMGLGTTFVITLPKYDRLKTKNITSKNTKILIVEDDSIVRNTISTVLKKRGFKVLSARDGIEALNLFKEEPADIIISDYFMPKMNGAELATKLKNSNFAGPIILTSGNIDNYISEKNIYFIKKPFLIPDLIKIVEKVS